MNYSENFIELPVIPSPQPSPQERAGTVDFTALRQRLEKSQGREYWRSMQELSETEEFQDFVKHEFPRDVELWMEPISRRDFLKLMGAGLALAFFTGCRR